MGAKRGAEKEIRIALAGCVYDVGVWFYGLTRYVDSLPTVPRQ